ncbi:hypothetical protein GCM10025879_02560 [Leuconostoc litchii]|uniref:Sugar transporter n=1 Tax=Leuconostoc litchii TaxID=1981069 RepID=A0A6P2CNW8_9LACO|nr:sugar transporter [Leuconostoc litchii]TYC47073.1 sugar transporter [Leuconostoc litchii]GMA69010.1 hypothetical protein GCM10025879_02560 [Leuconostoc litchii]
MKTATIHKQKQILDDDKQLQSAIENNRKDMSLKSMQYNRFMLIRYVTALFLFVNLYWALIMKNTPIVFLPVGLMVIISLTVIEQIKLFGQHTNQLVYSKMFFRIQLLVNMLLIISTPTSLFTLLFRFINDTKSNRLILSILLFIGLVILIIVNKRITLIASNSDKYYVRLLKYQDVIGEKRR